MFGRQPVVAGKLKLLLIKLKLLANENFPLSSVHILKKKGYDITAIGTDHSGVKDVEVMQIAMKEDRLILTFDRDYGELIFGKQLRPEMGVIYLRLKHFSPELPASIVLEILQNKNIELKRRLTVVDSSGIRQRKY